MAPSLGDLRSEVRGTFDQVAAGQEQIAGLLTRLIERDADAVE